MQKIGFCDKYSLTQAVLNGTKTMTRRVEKGLETFEFDYEVHFVHSMEIINQYWDEEKNSLVIITPQGKMKVPTRYKLGEVVAVAQSYNSILSELEDPRNFDCMEHWEAASAKRAHYVELVDFPGWNNKLFVSPSEMIHQIQIKYVHIERLQAISDEDCLKEGIIQSVDGVNMYTFDGWIKKGYQQYSYTSPREAFAALINRPGVGRKGLWEDNPFVVVYEFKLVK
jgi:hypothetical protein